MLGGDHTEHGNDDDSHKGGFVSQVIYTFQVLDTIGRFVPNLGINLRPRYLIAFTLARSVFIPLFICTSLYPTVNPFHFDWFKHMQMGLFALTNGVSATLSMVGGPQRVPNDKAEQEVAGYTMGFALINGIFVGSILGICTNLGLDQ
mmetsp:Transcript_3743/g.3349  ORF Transcript_3743/g.3349 Transcript_3743/m.3349 type:complete len:147 (-) Transcript_3743:167-607(-)